VETFAVSIGESIGLWPYISLLGLWPYISLHSLYW